jgi:predicted HicB family RNase H-like nuclease
MMQYKGYLGRVEFDADARLLHGEVVGIRDVVTFQSRTVTGIEREFRESVDDYLSYCKERGEQPDLPLSGHFIVRADSNLHRQLSTLAHFEGKSLNSLVVDYLTREAAAAFARMESDPTSSAKRRPPRRKQRAAKVA